MARLINFLLSQRYLLATLSILLGGAISLGALKTTINSSDDAILSEDDPYRLEVAQVNKDFPPSTSVLFAFMSPEGDVFNRDMLQAMQDLTDRYTDVESAVSVASLINRRLDAVDADIHERDYLLPELDELTAQDLVKIREIALADKDLTQSMLSPEGDMALAVIKFHATSEEQATQLRIAKTVIDLRDSLREQYPEQNIYVLGRILFEYDSYNAQIKDAKYLFPIVMLTILGLMYFCLRSLSFALAIAVVSVMSVGLTVGTVGWAQVPFNQISNMGPLVVFMIAMADSIHLVSVYLQGLHKSLSKFEALRESLRVNIQPVTLATVTTVRCCRRARTRKKRWEYQKFQLWMRNIMKNLLTVW